MAERAGPRIGLFGGSFDPAHAGHLHAATTARRACRLDRVWWMPSPQNPLKPAQPAWRDRADTVRELGLPPGHRVSDIEREYGTTYTIDLLRRLRIRRPATRFVFIMGADNFAQLPQWREWRAIVETVPICVVARPGPASLKARLGPAARLYATARVPEVCAQSLPSLPPPAWTFLTAPLNALSSTALRATMARAERSV